MSEISENCDDVLDEVSFDEYDPKSSMKEEITFTRLANKLNTLEGSGNEGWRIVNVSFVDIVIEKINKFLFIK